jgi:recombinational DNA repair protein RecR
VNDTVSTKMAYTLLRAEQDDHARLRDALDVIAEEALHCAHRFLREHHCTFAGAIRCRREASDACRDG